MKSLLLGFFFMVLGITAWAQPVNDDCGGLIDLGPVPACPDDVFTNVDATASDIGFGNVPLCFNGGTVQNDVWFSFSTNDTLVDLTISLFGSEEGPNDPILNPQIALYRGDCAVDGLAELGCLSAEPGDGALQLDLLGLTPNTVYFIRVNDFSASATPNWGDFTLCVEEYVPAINIGDSPGTTACFGTLYDSGGPDGDYGNNELHTFTICPNEPGCIEIELLNFNLENGFDDLSFYAGDDVTAPLIATITGGSSGGPFLIQASSACVTVQFDSDGSVTSMGFELTWSACTGQTCDASSIDNPTVISSLPFNSNDETTCNSAATFASSPCAQDAFLNGPEAVYIYESPGGLCASIQVTGADTGTGVLVLDGPPTDPNSQCVAQSGSGTIAAADFQEAGTYYIVVANGSGCTDFNLLIDEAECSLSPALVDALCNPLNGCIEEGGVPSVFLFEDGFQDMEITAGVNDGCWLGVGVEPDFYWFTIQAEADGPFGFILESGDVPSDIDFSVWGPFTQTEVCETPDDVVDFIANNQPIRSSWAAGADPTGLVDIHPILGVPVTDAYDCTGGPGADGDDFVSTISVTEGEVYVVLVNDWGNQIGEAGISVDWNPSEPAVLAPPTPLVMGTDTAVCSGESVPLTLISAVGSVQWIDPDSTLSCHDCFDPIATPGETTVYKAVIDAVCYQDTIEVEVQVFMLDAGPDLQLCSGQSYELNAGAGYEAATYEWSAPPGISLSCLDCPNPEIVSDMAGTYELSVTLTGPNCVLTDEVLVEVSSLEAPAYDVAADTAVCLGESVFIGGPEDSNPTVTYSWESTPAGFVSAEANPEVSPTETTVYQLTVTGGECPAPIVDSVRVEVFTDPTGIELSADTLVCQSDDLQLAVIDPEPDVTYAWTGPAEIVDPADPNTLIFPQESGAYILTATRGACAVSDTVQVEVTEIAVDIDFNLADTTICRGAEVDLQALTSPVDLVAEWTAGNGPVIDTTNALTVAPGSVTTYFATVSVPGCIRTDSVTIRVDSLPADLSIMPADTMVCQGAQVLLTSTIYDPGDFPEIEFEWTPLEGQQTPDSLFNMLLTPDTTRQYQRITRSGVCVDTATMNVEVEIPVPITIDPVDPTICFGESIQLTATPADDLPDISWEPAETLSCEECLDPVATPSQTTTYTITGGELGCSGASVTVNVISPPVLEPNGGVICLGEDRQLNLAADTISTYTWTSPDDPDFNSDDPLLTVSPDVTTTYVLTAVNGCATVEEEITVLVVQPATLNVPDDLTICSNEPLTLTAEGSAPATVEQSYVWQWPGNSFNGPELFLDELAETTTFQLTYTYGPGCGTLEATVTVTVNPAPSVTFPEETVLCPGDSIVLNLEPDEEFTTYAWSSPDDPGFSSNEPAPLVTPGQTTTYEVVATTDFCPPLEASLTIVVAEPPNLQVPADTIVCPGDPLTLTAVTDAGPGVPETFVWTVDGTPFTGPTLTLDAVTEPTSIDLTYTYGDDCGTLLREVFVDLDAPVFIDSIQVVSEQLDSVTTQIPGGVPFELVTDFTPDDGFATGWSWDGEGSPGIENGPVLTPDPLPEPGDYTYFFTVTTNAGCVYTTSIDITIIQPLAEMPNAFTPNGDGDNDRFGPVIFGGMDITEFKVYNRWGQLVYDNEDPQGWDGNHNGNPAPSDVYMYMIVIESEGLPEPIRRQGEVVLLR